MMNHHDDYARGQLHKYVAEGRILVGSSSSPWTWQCWYACDEALALYFVSKSHRRHSQELNVDPRISGSLLLALPIEGPGQPVRSIFFEGIAVMVDVTEAEELSVYYCSRWKDAPKCATAGILSDSEGLDRLWKITPNRFVLYDETDSNLEGPRVELTEW